MCGTLPCSAVLHRLPTSGAEVRADVLMPIRMLNLLCLALANALPLRPGSRIQGALHFVVLLCTLALPASVLAQGVELSRADRLAILYTPQLSFAQGGEPLIKIGLAEGVSSMTFQADTPVDVMPLGSGGPEVRVPADTWFTVTMQDGQAGTYVHSVVVAQLTPVQRDGLAAIRTEWESQGYDVRTVEVGSIFAVSGRRFDTRKTLVTVSPGLSLDEAQTLAQTLTDERGLDTRVHSELDGYPGGTLVMSGLPGGMTITHRDLLFVRGDTDTVFTVRDVPFDVGTRNEGVETRSYVGSLYFTADRNGALALGNETTIERLLQGVVASEIYASAPEDALRAQAVAARSELLTDLGVRHLADPWMTCSDQRCQVYRGINIEDERTSAAVHDTRGQVLTDGDQIIKAYFSSNNGGFAGSNATTWGEEQRSYLVARADTVVVAPEWQDGLNSEEEVREFLDRSPDAYSDISSFASGRNFRWETSMTAAEVTATVRLRADVGDVTDLQVIERDPSGRITRLRVVGTSGERVIERELNVRRALGGLRSALFVMNISRNSVGNLTAVTFVGAGFGHGVGLCQSGAIGAAERGMPWQDILAHYYPSTTLRALY